MDLIRGSRQSGLLQVHDCLSGPGLDGRRSGISFHFRPGLALEPKTSARWRIRGTRMDIRFRVDAEDWDITEGGEPVAQGFGRMAWGPVLRLATGGTDRARKIVTEIALVD